MPIFTINDADTRQPVLSAKVFVYTDDGSSVVGETDANGSVALGFVGTVQRIAVTADGYQVGKFDSLQTTVDLKRTASSRQTIAFVVNPVRQGEAAAATANGFVTLSDADGNTLESLRVSDEGLTSTAQLYAPGTYQLSVTKDGFQPYAETFTITNDFTKPVLLVKAGEPTTTVTAPDQTNPDAPKKPTLVLPPEQLDTYEFIYPNSVDGKYFQAAQARMYIGNLFIDELALCQWQLMDNKVPVFGYRSRKFDAMGTGHSLVQGQIAVNFVTEGYLYTVLKEYAKKMSGSMQAAPDGVDPGTADEIYRLCLSRAANTNPAALQSINDRLAELANTSPQCMAYVKSQVNNGRRQLQNYTGGSTFDFQNAVYLDIPFDIVVEFEGAGRTVTRKLTQCFLGANDFVVAHDGKTLLDTYGFLARDLA